MLPVEVSASDLMRLGVLTEDEASASLKKAAKRLKSEGLIKRYTPSTGIFILETHGEMECIYLNRDGLKKRYCTVYEKRPEVCRRFPAIGPKPGSCPHEKA